MWDFFETSANCDGVRTDALSIDYKVTAFDNTASACQ